MIVFGEKDLDATLLLSSIQPEALDFSQPTHFTEIFRKSRPPREYKQKQRCVMSSKMSRVVDLSREFTM